MCCHKHKRTAVYVYRALSENFFLKQTEKAIITLKKYSFKALFSFIWFTTYKGKKRPWLPLFYILAQTAMTSIQATSVTTGLSNQKAYLDDVFITWCEMLKCPNERDSRTLPWLPVCVWPGTVHIQYGCTLVHYVYGSALCKWKASLFLITLLTLSMIF